jgi:hypothetical protein
VKSIIENIYKSQGKSIIIKLLAYETTGSLPDSKYIVKNVIIVIKGKFAIKAAINPLAWLAKYVTELITMPPIKKYKIYFICLTFTKSSYYHQRCTYESVY